MRRATTPTCSNDLTSYSWTDRTRADTLGFTAGVHCCLGASLAKLEAGTTITSLIRRFPDVQLSGDPGWRDRLTIRGVDHPPLSLG